MKALKITLVSTLVFLLIAIFANLHLLREIGGVNGALTVFAGFGLIVFGGYRMNKQNN